MTIKKDTGDMLRREEFEFDIEPTLAKELFSAFEHNSIEKVRYIVKNNYHLWEVDVFGGKHEGLIVAEIEFNQNKSQLEIDSLILPDWVGEEVTNDHQYTNSCIAFNRV
jgi:CYTH domain-containing protein